jgi:hypothetical protein
MAVLDDPVDFEWSRVRLFGPSIPSGPVPIPLSLYYPMTTYSVGLKHPFLSFLPCPSLLHLIRPTLLMKITQTRLTLTILLEDQLPLCHILIVLSPSTVFSSL